MSTNVIFATPDFMLILAEKAREMGKDPGKDFSLEKGVFIGHPIWKRRWEPTDTKKSLETTWGIESFSGYGSMEMFTGFYECCEHRGHHTYPDLHYLEIVDPATGEILYPREEGELVVTHLKLEGDPPYPLPARRYYLSGV